MLDRCSRKKYEENNSGLLAVQCLEQRRVPASGAFLIPSASCEIGPVRDVLEGFAIGAVLQVLGAQNARAATGVNDIFEGNFACGTVISLPLGRDWTPDVWRPLPVGGGPIGACSVGPRNRFEVDRLHLDPFKPLGARLLSVPEQLLIGLRADEVPSDVVSTAGAEVGDW